MSYKLLDNDATNRLVRQLARRIARNNNQVPTLKAPNAVAHVTIKDLIDALASLKQFPIEAYDENGRRVGNNVPISPRTGKPYVHRKYSSLCDRGRHNRYPPTFKESVLRKFDNVGRRWSRVTPQTHNVAKVAREFGISTKTIKRWLQVEEAKIDANRNISQEDYKRRKMMASRPLPEDRMSAREWEDWITDIAGLTGEGEGA
jgi:uncharacterized protein YqcC (DUF446 family)